MLQAVRERLRALPEWFWVLAAVYFIHGAFVGTFADMLLVLKKSQGLGVLDVSRPLKFLPNSVFWGWDGEVYRALSQKYEHAIWPPLYPLTLRLLEWPVPAGRPSFPIAVQLLNFCSHIAMAAGLSAAGRAWGLRSDRRACVILCVFFFPGNNVYFAAYSESLFLAFAVWCCVLYERRQLAVAGLLGALAVLTRNMGVFLAVALLAAEVWRLWGTRATRSETPGQNPTDGDVVGAVRFAAHPAWAALPLATALGWYCLAMVLFGAAPAEAAGGFADELRRAVPTGWSPRVWVAVELLSNWRSAPLVLATLAAVPILLWRRRVVEGLFVAAFLASFLVYLYRPYPYTRYLSVLYPVVLLYVGAVRSRLVLLVAVLLCVVYSEYRQLILFSGWAGEP